MASDVDQIIQEKFNDKDENVDKYNEFVDSFVGTTSDDLEYLKEYVTISGKEFEADLIDAQIDSFQEYYQNSTDQEEIEEMQKFIMTSEEWSGLFEEYADSPFWEDEIVDEPVEEQSEDKMLLEEEEADTSYDDSLDEEVVEEVDSQPEELLEETSLEESEEE
jgi:hypothetical protein